MKMELVLHRPLAVLPNLTPSVTGHSFIRRNMQNASCGRFFYFPTKTSRVEMEAAESWFTSTSGSQWVGNGGAILLPGDTWQCLVTFLTVSTR